MKLNYCNKHGCELETKSHLLSDFETIKSISNILLFSSPILIGALLIISITHPAKANPLVLIIIAICLIADIIDGIIASKLNLSTTQFRLLDTPFELAFYLSTLVYAFSVYPDALKAISNLIILIYLLLKSWDHDIPSSYHAWLLRNEKTITRHQLLNG